MICITELTVVNTHYELLTAAPQRLNSYQQIINNKYTKQQKRECQINFVFTLEFNHER
ncbi:hypothetical protein CIT292_09397 [Citrobacter youngae ATCC 29220]|uniref:Uncharacterized protein n=1 Tax=Citrobacter youngae ATCC 29220 TaxID=500640 RepID=D4BF30_9ENTR|nr:hypothetical protein CIT292_09397 [Citrobacter youngae ATCC 29220]